MPVREELVVHAIESNRPLQAVVVKISVDYTKVE